MTIKIEIINNKIFFDGQDSDINALYVVYALRETGEGRPIPIFPESSSFFLKSEYFVALSSHAFFNALLENYLILSTGYLIYMPDVLQQLKKDSFSFGLTPLQEGPPTITATQDIINKYKPSHPFHFFHNLPVNFSMLSWEDLLLLQEELNRRGVTEIFVAKKGIVLLKHLRTAIVTNGFVPEFNSQNFSVAEMRKCIDLLGIRRIVMSTQGYVLHIHTLIKRKADTLSKIYPKIKFSGKDIEFINQQLALLSGMDAIIILPDGQIKFTFFLKKTLEANSFQARHFVLNNISSLFYALPLRPLIEKMLHNDQNLMLDSIFECHPSTIVLTCESNDKLGFFTVDEICQMILSFSEDPGLGLIKIFRNPYTQRLFDENDFNNFKRYTKIALLLKAYVSLDGYLYSKKILIDRFTRGDFTSLSKHARFSNRELSVFLTDEDLQPFLLPYLKASSRWKREEIISAINKKQGIIVGDFRLIILPLALEKYWLRHFFENKEQFGELWPQRIAPLRIPHSGTSLSPEDTLAILTHPEMRNFLAQTFQDITWRKKSNIDLVYPILNLCLSDKKTSIYTLAPSDTFYTRDGYVLGIQDLCFYWQSHPEHLKKNPHTYLDLHAKDLCALKKRSPEIRKLLHGNTKSFWEKHFFFRKKSLFRNSQILAENENIFGPAP